MSGKVGPEGEGGGTILTEEEKKQLMSAIEETAKTMKSPEKSKEESK
jgi:hypothetical protein